MTAINRLAAARGLTESASPAAGPKDKLLTSPKPDPTLSTPALLGLRCGERASAADPCQTCGARAHSVCSAVEEKALTRLARATTVVEFEAGESLVGEGEDATHVFNVTHGVVKVYKLLADGRRQVTGFLFAGDFLGFGADEHSRVSAEALTAVRVCRFHKRAFRALLDQFPAMEARLLGIAGSEIEAAQEQMLLLGRKTAKERIASFLLSLSRRAERLGRPADPVSLAMSRSDIADYLGLTTETVSRVFTQLKTQGLIRLSGANEVSLTRRRELASLAEGA